MPDNESARRALPKYCPVSAARSVLTWKGTRSRTKPFGAGRPLTATSAAQRLPEAAADLGEALALNPRFSSHHATPAARLPAGLGTG